MRHPDYPLWSFLGLIAVLLPAAWHWRARNISTLAIILWLALGNLSLFVNTIVWADNYQDRSPVWCDISSRLFSAITFAMPACSLSQMRKLESVASTRQTILSARSRKRRMWEELVLCIILPLVMLPLLYIVQGHRYRLIESLGPGGVPIYFSWPGLIIAYIVPSLIAVASLVYACLAVRWFLVRRLQFRSILAASESHLTVDRYLRLIALAVGDGLLLLFSVAFLLGIVFSDLDQFEFSEYKSWDTVHAGFSVISQIPEETLAPSVYANFVISFYTVPIYSFLFFTFFGLGEEATADYVRAFRRLQCHAAIVGLCKPPRTVNPLGELPALGSKVVPLQHTHASAARSPNEQQAFGLSDERLSSDWRDGTRTEDAGARIGVTVERTVF